MKFAGACWTIWIILWLLFALRTKPTQRSEGLASRLRYSVLVTSGYVLLFWRRLVPLALRETWISAIPALEGLGAAIMLAGIGLTLWARVHLGANWSGTVTVKVNHGLIRTGPYARVRHPIYTGILLAAVGTAMLQREFSGLLGVALVFAGFWIKLRKEEQFMAETFGSAYDDYRRHTGALLPSLW